MSKRIMAKRIFALMHHYQISRHLIRHCPADPDSAFHVDILDPDPFALNADHEKINLVKSYLFVH
jgi:hypothetical protein